jgi:hypothetical protein
MTEEERAAQRAANAHSHANARANETPTMHATAFTTTEVAITQTSNHSLRLAAGATSIPTELSCHAQRFRRVTMSSTESTVL